MREITNQRIKLNFIKIMPFWLLFIFFILLGKRSWWATFQLNLILYISTKVSKTCMKIMVWHFTIFRYDHFWLIDTTTVMVPAQKNQLRQPSTTKFDSSWLPFWANGYDSFNLYQRPRFIHKKEKICIFHPLKMAMNSKQWGENKKLKFEKKSIIPSVFIYFSSRQLSPTSFIVSPLPLRQTS